MPDEIGALLNLEVLDLHGNQLTDLPKSLSNLKNLKKLILGNPFHGGNGFTFLPSPVGQLKNLEQLILSGNKIKTVIKEISPLKKLKMLWLNKNFSSEEIKLIKKKFPKIMIMQL